ncbi:hypothetical protein [Paenibacillus sp. Marseille-Q4541]|uniref:hypothetical protein n=1 Tax=Paenibacillus sp. Marseille-Q4541 TaxID=2831522 RepID=UPI001BA64ADE|nr:hypothetical protein [Paenibacillus sp. Marseille-Q4541]
MVCRNKRRKARNELNQLYRKLEIEKDPRNIALLRVQVRRLRKQKVLLKVNCCGNKNCQKAIYEGQQVFKVGSIGIYCTMSCWADSIGALTIVIGEEQTKNDSSCGAAEAINSQNKFC